MDNLRLDRVTLYSSNLHGNFFAIDNQGDGFAVERVKRLSNGDLVEVHSYGNGFLASTVYNCRDLLVTTQAAARTFPQVGT